MSIFDEKLHSVGPGWQPNKPGSQEANGPYAHMSANMAPVSPGTLAHFGPMAPMANAILGFRGASMGAGLAHGDWGGGASGDVLSANLNLGGWTGMDGKTNYGAMADAQVFKMAYEPGNALGPLGFDIGALDANAGVQVNDSTAGIGAQANLIEGAATLGNKEHSVRFGGSVGVGAAARAHYGDADGDGVRELGFGFDAGPVSFDVKSELLGHAWNGISSAGSWVGDKLGGAASAVGSFLTGLW